jgi:hypothetical protein
MMKGIIIIPLSKTTISDDIKATILPTDTLAMDLYLILVKKIK